MTLFLILFHSDICVDFLGTHMISLVLFFREPGVTVMDDRTRPVIWGAYWTPTGRWHCGVQSVLQRVRSVIRWSPAQA
jgi:hypothetical protein